MVIVKYIVVRIGRVKQYVIMWGVIKQLIGFVFNICSVFVCFDICKIVVLEKRVRKCKMCNICLLQSIKCVLCGVEKILIIGYLEFSFVKNVDRNEIGQEDFMNDGMNNVFVQFLVWQ